MCYLNVADLVSLASHVFDKCIVKMLKGKTRLVITHQTRFLERPEVDHIIILSPHGEIYAQGSFLELKLRDDDYISKCLFHVGSSALDSGAMENKEQSESKSAGQEKESDDKTKKKEKKTFVEKEAMFEGHIDPKHLWRYLTFFGSPLLIGTLIFSFLLEQTTTILNSWWLSRAVSSDPGSLEVQLYVYAGFGLGICVCSTIRIVLMILGGVNAAKTIHKSMFSALLHAPAKFFDVQLSGRILNRLVTDQSNVDSAVPSALSQVLSKLLYFGALLVILGVSFPYLLVVVVVLGIPYQLLSAFYRWSARDLRRLEAVSKSPINVHFSDTLKGITTIRTFGAERRFFERHLEILEENLCCFWNRWCTNQWVTVWLEFLGSLFTLSFSVLSVWAAASNLNVSAGLVGLVLSYAVQVPSNLGWLLKLFVQAEVEFVSLERIIEYVDLEQEKNSHQTPARLTWPEKGDIAMKNVKMRYNVDSDYILKGVNALIQPGTKVAVIGRTAAGKSSLFSALLKYYDFEGEIFVDGEQIGELSIDHTRKAIRLIPQSPALFGDTLKDALCGPTAGSTDEKVIWNYLDKIEMGESIRALPQKLETALVDTDFSAGQKQLLCLARALLNSVSCLQAKICSNLQLGTHYVVR
jgi:ABC-type multidrug transport system fused ATPase/permease subunit